MGLAYVRFAVEEPGRFALMFGPKELHGDRPGYQQVCNAAFDVLMDAVRELRTDLWSRMTPTCCAPPRARGPAPTARAISTPSPPRLLR